MRKFNFNNIKFNIKDKIKFNKLPKFKIDKILLRTIWISFLTTTFMMSLCLLAVFHYRTKIFNFINPNSGYLNRNNQFAVLGNSKSITDNNQQNDINVKGSDIIDVVKSANPAVVSIVITKEVPTYEVSYQTDPNANPFGDMFGNVFPGFQTPVYKQNGTKKQEIGSGSGFLVSPNGYIVTNRHVVSDPVAIYTVTLKNGKKYTAKVLDRDSILDVAIIKIEPPLSTKFPYLELGDSDKIQVGQSVIAIGNALGQFSNTVSVGVVSGLSRSITAGDNMGNSEQLTKVIQTDAAINPGNSGGPLLDTDGKVVGVNVAVVQGSENIGFSLPINSIKTVISSVEKTGKIVRPYVGLRFVPITADLKAKNNLTVDYGILVAKGATASDLAVIPGSPADIAGIVENDIVLEVDGQKIDSDHDFLILIRGKNVGDLIKLKVLSKGVEKTVSLKLKQAPENTQ